MARARKRRPPPATDDVVRGCLAALLRCDTSAIGVLADRMEELRLPYAKRVRQIWDNMQRRCARWQTEDMSRRALTAREAIGYEKQYARRQVANLFGRKWASTPVTKFV